MKYIRLTENNTVAEIIPGEDPAFPGVPIDKRFALSFINALIPIQDDKPVEKNWLYADGKFISQSRNSNEKAETARERKKKRRKS